MSHAFQFEINDATWKIELNYIFPKDMVAFAVCLPKAHSNALKALGASMDSKTFKENMKDIKGIRKMLKNEKNAFGVNIIEFIIQLITDGYKLNL